eukprot:8961517-Alexandrium_andersonii.AAC.1
MCACPFAPCMVLGALAYRAGAHVVRRPGLARLTLHAMLGWQLRPSGTVRRSSNTQHSGGVFDETWGCLA